MSLETVFHDFGVEAKVVAANVGPAVTQYEMEVKASTKVSRILGLNREIVLAATTKKVEDSITHTTQMARAAGISLIVVAGVVKANIPSLISFAVSFGIDSRTILDRVGDEQLLGKDDMLFLPQGENTPIRVQRIFMSDDEIKSVVDFVILQQKARFVKLVHLYYKDDLDFVIIVLSVV